MRVQTPVNNQRTSALDEITAIWSRKKQLEQDISRMRADIIATGKVRSNSPIQLVDSKCHEITVFLKSLLSDFGLTFAVNCRFNDHSLCFCNLLTNYSVC